ncbi:MAG: sulfurtransferase TusA family protein [Anaerolineae bacterium]
MKANATLDCTGLYCPMPIIETTDKMRELEIGQVLEVLADDKGIKTDMPAWCESTGNEFLGIEEEDGEYRVYVKKRVE